MSYCLFICACANRLGVFNLLVHNHVAGMAGGLMAGGLMAGWESVGRLGICWPSGDLLAGGGLLWQERLLLAIQRFLNRTPQDQRYVFVWLVEDSVGDMRLCCAWQKKTGLRCPNWVPTQTAETEIKVIIIMIITINKNQLSPEKKELEKWEWDG